MPLQLLPLPRVQLVYKTIPGIEHTTRAESIVRGTGRPKSIVETWSPEDFVCCFERSRRGRYLIQPHLALATLL